MKDVSIFIADPGNKKAILAVSALARAMKEMKKVAILRCVWRQGQGNVVVGVLTPNVSDKDNTVSFSVQFPLTPSFTTIAVFAFWFDIIIFICVLVSRIHFTSMFFLLLRMSESSSFPHSVTSLCHGSQMKNNKRQQITW